MHTPRLGCVSFPGIVATLAALLLLAGVSIAQGGVLYSPGGLSAVSGERPLGGVYSHAGTGGRCAACHAAPWDRQRMSERCLACHTDLVQDPHDFHRAMLAESEQRACQECHSEHRGPGAALTILDLQNFPHDTAGFSLRAHQDLGGEDVLTCSDCHAGSFTRFDAGSCAACHQEIEAAFLHGHQAAFGRDCLACHDGVDRYGRAFEHGQTDFALAGKHAVLACVDCHAGAGSIQDLQDTAQACYACHAEQDAHQGAYGQDCAACHSVEGWKPASFDHSQSAFPLEGAHLGVVCGECHTTGPAGAVFKGTPTACAGCHDEPVYHLGLFGMDQSGPNCEECHTSEAWSPAGFNRPHTFPLEHGESGPSACRVCHPASLQAYTCYGCHEHSPEEVAAEHREEGIGDFQDCMRCHPTGREKEGDEDD